MYKIFDKYLLRTPLLPVNFFLELTSQNVISESKFIEIFKNEIIREAIYLGSPILFNELDKWVNGEKSDKDGRLRNSLLKYISRMSSRPTPFGLFSGYTLGQFDANTEITLENNSNSRKITFDMSLIGLILKRLLKEETVKTKLLFFPNTSLYHISNVYRYVEAEFDTDSSLIQKMIEIESTDYIQKTIKFSREGKTFFEIAEQLVSEDISLDEAKEYINELITSQILTSEIELTVSGDEPFQYILDVLDKYKIDSSFTKTLNSIKLYLDKINDSFPCSVLIYKKILELLEELGITYNRKYIFQGDLLIGTKTNKLGHDIAKDLKQAITIINKLSSHVGNISNNTIEDFKKSFYERYETEEISLAVALDSEMGIGYPSNSLSGGENPLLKNLDFNKVSNENIDVTWSDFDSLLLNKIIKTQVSKSNIISINENDVPSGEINWSDLPATFSSMAQIVNINNEDHIIIDGFGGNSAGSLLGRFCHSDPTILDYVKEIVKKEDQSFNNIINAEIVHLPEDRLGNILLKPELREYEIPYLARSQKRANNKILINDLYISIRNNRIVLRSEKLNREISPKLTNAHNYTQSSLPIYRFLCDIQNTDKRKVIYWGWNDVFNKSLSVFPRIQYKNIILSTTKWKIQFEEIKYIMNTTNNEEILESTKIFIKNKKIPSLVYLVDGDNKLLINLKNLSSILSLFQLVKNKKFFILEEFLFENAKIGINTDEESFVNEFIFSFYSN
ncbi:MAG: lantibiotic dehydratase family protein [Flavobacteriaceae bacterium]|nr:lantibiotic dehydratase family protein [Flavobacteriaceae bacterium]